MNRQKATQRPAFTLVEVLIVIAIIGVLMGLAVTAVNVARRTIQARSIALEVESIAQAVEAYKTKFGSYPPDGYSRAAFETHFRSVFPNIQPSEFTVLYASVAGKTADSVMDPAEALVFCLGGFSNNPTRPFTGSGGPLTPVPASNPVVYQYNTDRNEGPFQFRLDLLTLDDTSGQTVSNDEVLFGVTNVAGRDVIPAYVPSGRDAPLVYFSSTTYRVDSFAAPVMFQSYDTNRGIARPYKSDKVNNKIDTSNWSSLPVAQRDRYYIYANDKSFQIISAGLDDDFGGGAVFFRFPSGTPLDATLAPTAQPTGANYSVGGLNQITQLDNVTNFSEGALSDSLP